MYFTYPNNDAGGIEIFETINSHAKNIKNSIVRESLGRRLYWGLLNLSKDPKKNVICIGNSSSGIKETATFNCPTINIGTRQNGRLRSTNIIDCDYNDEQIYMAIKKCLDDDTFKNICATSINPYGLGGAGEKIANHLSKIEFNDKLLTKKMTI